MDSIQVDKLPVWLTCLLLLLLPSLSVGCQVSLPHPAGQEGHHGSGRCGHGRGCVALRREGGHGWS